MKYQQLRGIIVNEDGRIVEAHVSHENNPAEFPPVHGMAEGQTALEIFGSETEIPIERFNHAPFSHAMLFETTVANGRLHRNGLPMAAELVPRSRMRGGVLEDNTLDGWRRRVIFVASPEPGTRALATAGGLVSVGWCVLGAVDRKKDGPRLISINKPAPGDRRVWSGPEARPIPPESVVSPDE